MADVSTWSFGYLEYFVKTRNTPATKWKPGFKQTNNPPSNALHDTLIQRIGNLLGSLTKSTITLNLFTLHTK